MHLIQYRPMLDPAGADKVDQKLQLFRQLYDRSRERHGEAHEQTRTLLELISRLESQPPAAGTPSP